MTKPTVLVIDDQAIVRQTIAAQLAQEPFVLRFAENGVEALQLLAGPPPDVVICDVMMPGMDGYTVLRAFKEHPIWKFVPVMMLTALDDQENVCHGLETGADEFLTKPVNGPVLRARVRALLRIRNQYEQLKRAPAPENGARSQREQLIEQAGLTERERGVLELLLLGRTHQDIAAALEITERTSKFHQANLLRKLGAESRLDLLRLFV